MGYFSTKLTNKYKEKSRQERLSCSGTSISINASIPQISFALTKFKRQDNGLELFEDFLPKLNSLKSLIYTDAQIDLISQFVHYSKGVEDSTLDFLFLRLKNSKHELNIKLRLIKKLESCNENHYFNLVRKAHPNLKSELNSATPALEKCVDIVQFKNHLSKDNIKFVLSSVDKKSNQYLILVIHTGLYNKNTNTLAIEKNKWVFSQYLRSCPKKRFTLEEELLIMKKGKDFTDLYRTFLTSINTTD